MHQKAIDFDDAPLTEAVITGSATCNFVASSYHKRGGVEEFSFH